MPLHTFDSLCSFLRAIPEMVAIFIAAVGHGDANRQIQEHWQHSGETVSRLFNKVPHALLVLFKACVRVPVTKVDSEYESAQMKDGRKYQQYFSDCIGALDGTHIRVSVSSIEAPAYRNKQGGRTQKCTGGMRFQYRVPVRSGGMGGYCS